MGNGEEYFDYDGNFSLVEAVNNAFHLKDIEKVNDVVRFYYLQSFKPGKVYEIHLNDSGKIARYRSGKDMFGTDLHVCIPNKSGIIASRIKKNSKCEPAVPVVSNTIIDENAYQKIVDVMKRIGIETMKCIRCTNVLVLDGTTIKVHMNLNGKVNRFYFNSDECEDRRYHEIEHEIIKTIDDLFIPLKNLGDRLNDVILSKVKRYILAIEPSAEIFLISPRAKKNVNEFSSWFFFVLVDGKVPAAREKKIQDILYEIECQTGESIEARVKSRKEWNATERQTIPFRELVKGKGILL